jgi:hypothetical protein
MPRLNYGSPFPPAKSSNPWKKSISRFPTVGISTDASTRYAYTSTPIACTEEAGKMVVTSHLVGNFPGSPVELRFFFKLEGDKIASLEITL